MRTRLSRLQPRSCEVVDTTTVVLRPAQHHFDLVKSNIIDGCTSSTCLFDEEVGETPKIFRQGITRFELAQEILNEGYKAEAQKVASDGVAK